MRRASTIVPDQQRVSLTIAAQRQSWHRSTAVGGERVPAGRIHAVLGASARTLCGLGHAELALFPYLDFVESALERCDICRRRGALLLQQ
jgi:hypothetical protein